MSRTNEECRKIQDWLDEARRLENSAYAESHEKRSYELLAAGYASSLHTLLMMEEMADSNAAQEAWGNLEEAMRKVDVSRVSIKEYTHRAEVFRHKANNPDTYLKEE